MYEQRSHDPPPSLLAGLLGELFSVDELRRYLVNGPDGADLGKALPSGHASLDQLTHDAVELLTRRGLVGPEFFARLERERPGKRDAILKVRRAWLGAPNLEAGVLWGTRYRFQAQIGDGGFGSVWRAVDEQTGQLVALKILHERHGDNARARQRFYRGAQSLAGLSHPAIVRVLAAALEDGRHSYYVMEYVRGVTLDVCVRERRHPTAVLLDMALQVGDALIHVHQRGLLHRDIKPGNIIITERNTACLIDFDLVTGDDYLTTTTEAVGTGLYMPPEAHTSDRKTPAYDVFGLARTIEFILRGREPTFRESTDVVDLAASAEVKAILRAALQRDPQLRIADMATFCAALRDALAGPSPTPRRPKQAHAPRPAARPPPSPEAEPPPPPADRLPTVFAALASVFGHMVALVYLAPSPRGVLFFLIFFTAPSVRVLFDGERNRVLTIVHWIWLALWSLPALGILGGLFGSSAKSGESFPMFVMLVAIGLGAYASVLHLRRAAPTPE